MGKTQRLDGGHWIERPEPVQAPETLAQSCVKETQGGPAVTGFMARRLLPGSVGKPINLPAVRPTVEDGFGATPLGEDRFDAWAGLLGMLAAGLGLQAAGAPPDAMVRSTLSPSGLRRVSARAF